MKDKAFFKRLRVLMAAGSITGFVGGWALLAQTDQNNFNDSVAVAQVINTTPVVELSPTATTTSAQATNTAIAAATATPTATATPLTQITTKQTTTSSTRQTRLRTGGS